MLPDALFENGTQLQFLTSIESRRWDTEKRYLWDSVVSPPLDVITIMTPTPGNFRELSIYFTRCECWKRFQFEALIIGSLSRCLTAELSLHPEAARALHCKVDHQSLEEKVKERLLPIATATQRNVLAFHQLNTPHLISSHLIYLLMALHWHFAKHRHYHFNIQSPILNKTNSAQHKSPIRNSSVLLYSPLIYEKHS